MSNSTTDTTRPAVAIVSYHDSAGAGIDTGPEYFLGYWQPDGDWTDIDAGPGGTGLLETMRDRMAEQPVIRKARVTWQDFGGEMWDRTYTPDQLAGAGGGGFLTIADDDADSGGDRR